MVKGERRKFHHYKLCCNWIGSMQKCRSETRLWPDYIVKAMPIYSRLVLQEDYEAELEWAKKLILTSVENILRPTIVEKTTSQEMWKALTGLFEATNKSRLRLLLLLRDTFAVSDYKYKSVTEKA